MVFEKIKKALKGSKGGSEEDYLEIDVTQQEQRESKVFVKLFVLKQYEDVNEVLNSLREGYTIAIMDIKTLKQKDPIELKRAISKVKKTSDALGGNIAGFGENLVIVTPAFAKIHREVVEKPKEKKDFDDY